MQYDINKITDKKNEILSTGISGSTLKIIAILTMLIDHIGASILTDIRWSFLRAIGRLAFPIFIFLLVEGFFHTSNKWKYLARLVVLAFISEIPFDMAFFLDKESISKHTYLEFSYQNVYFTLALGLLAIIILDIIQKREEKIGIGIRFVLFVLTWLAVAYLAHLLHTDYGKTGVSAIIVMFISRRKLPKISMLNTCIVLITHNFVEVPALFAIPMVNAYNGKRGLKIKWLFYFFYPVHLMILGIIKYLI